MSKPLKSYYEATHYLGQYIGTEVPFLLATSCMSPDRRKQIAVLRWINEDLKDIDVKKMSREEIFKKVLMPLLEKLGFAEWVRDTVTDMAIRKGIKADIDFFNIEDKDKKE